MQENRIIQYAFQFERAIKLKQKRKEELITLNKMRLCELILSYDKSETYSFKQLQNCYKIQLIDVVLQFEQENFFLEKHVQDFLVEVRKDYGCTSETTTD